MGNITLAYLIIGTIGEIDYYWGGRNEKGESLWSLDLANSWKIPSYHHLKRRIELEFPDDTNIIDGTPTSDIPNNFRILERGLDNVVRPCYYP